jgi:hypothetical protein
VEVLGRDTVASTWFSLLGLRNQAQRKPMMAVKAGMYDF